MRSALLAIVVAVFALSCDSATAPEPVTPESSSDLLNIGKVLKRILPEKEGGDEDGRGGEDGGGEEDGRGEDGRGEHGSGGEDGRGDGNGSSQLTFVVESGPDQPRLVSSIFGILGGVLSLDGHGIAVPRGAVLRPTLFTMETVSGPVIDVDLNAFQSNLLNRVLSRLGLFNHPVRLDLSYAGATNVVDPSRLVIVRLHEDGTYEVLPTRVDLRRRTVSADLDHFSKYAMASN
jgi:hypothetical protein